MRCWSLAGKDRGKQGTINRMVIKGDLVRAVVGGVNIVKKHIKSRPGVRQAGIMDMEAPLHISNLHAHLPALRQANAHRAHTSCQDGRRVRVCKKCDQVIDRS